MQTKKVLVVVAMAGMLFTLDAKAIPLAEVTFIENGEGNPSVTFSGLWFNTGTIIASESADFIGDLPFLSRPFVGAFTAVLYENNGGPLSDWLVVSWHPNLNGSTTFDGTFFSDGAAGFDQAPSTFDASFVEDGGVKHFRVPGVAGGLGKLFFSVQSDTESGRVPDGGATAALLGLSIAGLGVFRRRAGLRPEVRD